MVLEALLRCCIAGSSGAASPLWLRYLPVLPFANTITSGMTHMLISWDFF